MNKAVAILLVLIGAASGFFVYKCRYDRALALPKAEASQKAAAATTTARISPYKRNPDTVLSAIMPKASLGTARVIAASPKIFAYAHGTAEADGRFVIGMADKAGNPYPRNQLTFFTDEADLSRPQLINAPEDGDVQSVVYDPVTDKVYFELSSSGRLSIYSLDPHNLLMKAIVSTTSIDVGRRPAIATDGTYIYGITSTDPSLVFRVRISDGSLLVSYTGHIPNGHSAAIGNGAVFFGGGMSNGFEKVDPETLGSLGRVSLAPCSMSDDMPFVDGFIYVGCETVPYGLRVHADTLKADRFTLPGGSFGLFSFGGDLYNAAQDGYVDEFPKGDLKDLKRFKVVNDIAPFDTKGQDLEVNELLFSPVTKHLYLTAWLGIPGLYEVDLAIP